MPISTPTASIPGPPSRGALIRGLVVAAIAVGLALAFLAGRSAPEPELPSIIDANGNPAVRS